MTTDHRDSTDMKRRRKAFALLNSRDFESNPIWLVELPERAFATTINPLDDIADYGPYVALTVYTLADSTRLRGYCFAYDTSGHVLFGSDGEPIHLLAYNYRDSCSPEDAAAFALRLGKAVEDAFPIRFKVSVTYYGSVQEGEITVQSYNC
jgi:hypothetical protein